MGKAGTINDKRSGSDQARNGALRLDKASRRESGLATIREDEEEAERIQFVGSSRSYGMISDSNADEALIQQHTISHFERPADRSLKTINYILSDPSSNGYLLGADYKSWSDAACVKDLVTLGRVEKIDQTSYFIVKIWFSLVYKILRKRPSPADSIVHIQESSLLLPTQILSIILSSLLPVAAIAVLHVVRSTWRRLFILAAFTLTFSLTLALITANSKRLEIFAATAT